MSKNGEKFKKEHNTETFMSFVGRDWKEWKYMWKQLGDDIINTNVQGDSTVAEDKGTGECWQYMDTSFYSFENTLALCHNFRHRNHPKTGNREYRIYPVSENFYEEWEKKTLNGTYQ